MPGHKWSLTALKRHLRAAGYNVDMIWSQIYDLVIKTLISIEAQVRMQCHNPYHKHTQHLTALCMLVQVTAAQRMFVPGANCFELFGFDVLIDEDLHPWLLEVLLYCLTRPLPRSDSPTLHPACPLGKLFAVPQLRCTTGPQHQGGRAVGTLHPGRHTLA